MPGERWFVALRGTIASLANLPSRCALAPESRDSPVEVRQSLYGRRPHVYRILFAIEGDVVQVLHIRHARRRPARLEGR
jgi:plasmid stabilization system protein ParE